MGALSGFIEASNNRNGTNQLKQRALIEAARRKPSGLTKARSNEKIMSHRRKTHIDPLNFKLTSSPFLDSTKR